MRRGVAMMAGALILSGCVTTTTEEPLLTKKVFYRLSKACGVTPTHFGKLRNGMPYVDLVYHDAAAATEDHAAPSIECMDRGLKRYRYDHYGIVADPPEPED